MAGAIYPKIFTTDSFYFQLNKIHEASLIPLKFRENFNNFEKWK